MNTTHNLPRRVILAAALLANRYSNPEVAAYNRAGNPHLDAGTRRYRFWFSVGRALSCGGFGLITDYEFAVRSDIRRTMDSFKTA